MNALVKLSILLITSYLFKKYALIVTMVFPKITCNKTYWYIFLNRSEDIDISVGSPNILDTKLEALEQRLLNHIDLKISEMETRINSKLDDILHQLSRKSTTETES